jgi:putative redox protein
MLGRQVSFSSFSKIPELPTDYTLSVFSALVYSRGLEISIKYLVVEEYMAEAVVKWLEGGVFVGTDSTKHSVVLSNHDEENGVGMRPTELLLIALASCTAVDVVNILAKKRMQLDGLEIVVKGEQDPEPPWTFENIKLTYRLRGEGLSESACAKAINLSDEKYCSVAATLRSGVPIEHDFVILDD